MKDYMKPEIEQIEFTSESIADQGNVSGEGSAVLPG